MNISDIFDTLGMISIAVSSISLLVLFFLLITKKRKKKCIIVLFTSFILTFLFLICSILTDPATWCDHNWVITKKVDATCTEKGYIEYYCDLCNSDKKDITSDPLGHSLEEIEDFQKSKIILKCIRCDYEETKSIISETETGEETEPTQSNYDFEIQFFLEAGKKGDYGRLLTYNAGTEFEETFYAYYVPSGKYLVSNTGTYPTQVNVYSDETQFVNGWEEPKDCSVFLLQKGESKEIIILNGYHVEITEPTYILMQKIKETTDTEDETKTTNSKDTEQSEQLENTEKSEEKRTYILNTNTHVFHKETCYHASRIKAKNKKVVEDDRENLIDDGYSPCKTCDP
ncbi:MAG: hypothetical protein IJW55_07350 [Clostridia bacterium]|nr:hypothetical protein [Clostridia bacterium]